MADVHHVHIWKMQEHETALEAHVVLEDGTDPVALRGRLKSLLAERFGIHHAMLEMETDAEACAAPQVIGH